MIFHLFFLLPILQRDKIIYSSKYNSNKMSVKCNLCNVVVKSRHDMTRDMRVHSKVKPISYEYCRIKFSRRSNVTAHLKKTCKMVHCNNPNSRRAQPTVPVFSFSNCISDSFIHMEKFSQN